jgi:hypothetical protein
MFICGNVGDRIYHVIDRKSHMVVGRGLCKKGNRLPKMGVAFAVRTIGRIVDPDKPVTVTIKYSQKAKGVENDKETNGS